MPEEPGAGLEHVRMMPPEERDPVPSGAGTSPGALHDSGPTPASIARDSRRSITASRGACVRGGGRFVVFRRFTGLLLGRPLRRGHTPLLGIHRRIGFLFRQGIGSRWDSIWRRRELNPRGSRRKGLVPGDECPAMRFRPAIGDEVCRSSFWGSSRSLVAQPGLTLPRPAPWPRSQPGRQRAGGGRRRQPRRGPEAQRWILRWGAAAHPVHSWENPGLSLPVPCYRRGAAPRPGR